LSRHGGGHGLGWSVLGGTVLFWLVLVGTGQMNWREEVHEALLVARHDDPLGAQGSDFTATFEHEFHRTHHESWVFWLLSFPLMVTGCTLVYFMPALIALARQDPRSDRILLITVFLSPTGIGWLWALYKALRGPPPASTGQAAQVSPPSTAPADGSGGPR
jgi:hypothetical protein